jgi:hypothetical protein
VASNLTLHSSSKTLVIEKLHMHLVLVERIPIKLAMTVGGEDTMETILGRVLGVLCE